MLSFETDCGPYRVLLTYVPAHTEGCAEFQMAARVPPGQTLQGVGPKEWEDAALCFLGSWPVTELTVESLNFLAGDGLFPLLNARIRHLQQSRAGGPLAEYEQFFTAATQELLAVEV